MFFVYVVYVVHNDIICLKIETDFFKIISMLTTMTSQIDCDKEQKINEAERAVKKAKEERERLRPVFDALTNELTEVQNAAFAVLNKAIATQKTTIEDEDKLNRAKKRAAEIYLVYKKVNEEVMDATKKYFDAEQKLWELQNEEYFPEDFAPF